MPSSTRVASVMDPEALLLGRVYAAALLDQATDLDEAGRLHEQLDAVVTLLEGIDGSRELLASGMDRDERVALVGRVFAGRTSERMCDFLSVLAEHGRLGLLGVIREASRRELLRRRDVREVWVTTAIPLDEELREQIARAVGEAVGGEVALREAVDESIVGGALIRVGDRVFDLTVASDLRRMRRAIARSLCQDAAGQGNQDGPTA
jgi:F-type H+-transporting ATPase subunit delta